ncbi:MAG TPA: carboxypeptidase-like regulatory domain-containing protein [Terriglobales bacterium]|nr:carboxypeptidase-like regulatory domain-containing protein [Terriglobales bacterium]
MKRTLWSGAFLLVLAALLGLSVAAWGQEVTAAIVGTVTDPSGAPIKDAAVTATDVERGTTWNAKTNESGAYNLPRVPIGTYKLEVSAPGFQKSVYPPFTLVLNQTARLDTQLKVGQVTETVEVTGAAPVLQTETTQVNTVIDAVTNDRLPLATRNYVQLTLLSPGSISPNPDSFNNGDNTANGARPYINGNREQANNFILDGLDNNQVSDNLLGYTPAPDAIAEFNLITQNASAEFGNYQGGVVSTSIKSGTNSFHGDLWEYFRNDKLNSNSWQNRFQGAPRDKLRWNMFGGTIGGPVIKNKLFFFFDYQGQRFDHPSTFQPISVFTTAERQGDFGDVCTEGFSAGICSNPAHQLYDPLNGNAPFANNVITEPIDPVAQALFASSLYPSPVGTGTQNNASYTQTRIINTNQYDVKIDFVASQSDHIYGRYSHAKQHNPTVNSFDLLGTGFSDAPINSEVVDWSHTFSPSLLNDVRFGINYVRLHNGTAFDSKVGDLGTQLGINNANAGGPGLLQLGFNGGTPSNSGSGLLTNIGSTGVQQKFNDAVIQASDTVIVTHGHHNLHLGFEYQRLRINTFYTGNSGALGGIYFNGNFTSSNPVTAGAGGYGGADFYLGLPSAYGKGISGGGWGQRSSVFAGFVQDDWRAKNNLTINIGLRYDVHTPWTEAHDLQDNFDLISGQLIAPNCARTDIGTAPNTCKQGSRALYNGNYGGKNLQPRIGFAWTPDHFNSKMVVRGAFSISSYLEGTGTNLRLPINPPFSPAETLQQYTNVALPATTTGDGLQPVGSASDPFAGALVRVWDQNVQPAITQQWNLTLQQQLNSSTTVQVGYVGQHGTHLMVPMPYLQKQLLSNSACGAPPCTAPSVNFSGNPAFQSDISQISGTASVGSMKYNALQAVLQKRYSSGLNYQVAYTFSKCQTDNSGYYGTWGDTQGTPANPYYQNLYQPQADWAECYFDAKHLLSAYAVYELPFGRGKKFGANMNSVANAIVGGWSIDPILSLHTGFPLALYDFGDDQTGTGSRGLRPNCGAGAGHTLGRTNAFDGTGKYVGYQYFDPTPYSKPSVGSFGNCPAQGPIRGPGYSDVDLSFQKDFHIRESVKLQFRADFVNTFNRVNLNAPDTSLGSGTMGQIGAAQGAQAPRNIQFALKLYY